eukprot:Hpha_TRINITY_DN18979_c0_g1::TRINITY_DN18979_c0_g1_i1::g.17487::m.17487
MRKRWITLFVSLFLFPQVKAQGAGNVVFMTADGVHKIKIDGSGEDLVASHSCNDCWGLTVDIDRGLVLWTDTDNSPEVTVYAAPLSGGSPEKRCSLFGKRARGLAVDPATGRAFISNFISAGFSGWELYSCDYTTSGNSLAPYPSQSGYKRKTYGDNGGGLVFKDGNVYLSANAQNENGPDFLVFPPTGLCSYLGMTNMPDVDYRVGDACGAGDEIYFAAAPGGGTFPAEIFHLDLSGPVAEDFLMPPEMVVPQWFFWRPWTPAEASQRGPTFAVVGDAAGWVVTLKKDGLALHDPADFSNPSTLFSASAPQLAGAGIGPVAWYGDAVPPPTAPPTAAPAVPDTDTPTKATAAPVEPTKAPVAGTGPPVPATELPTNGPQKGAEPPTKGPLPGVCPDQPPQTDGVELGAGCNPLKVDAACAAGCKAGYSPTSGVTPVLFTCPAGTLTGSLECSGGPSASPVGPQPSAPPVLLGSPTAPP